MQLNKQADITVKEISPITASPNQKTFAQTIRNTLRSFPPAMSLRKQNLEPTFTLRINEDHRLLCNGDAIDQYQEASISFAEIQRLYEHLIPEKNDTVYEVMEKNMIKVVFGSNAIEFVGGDLRMPIRICKEIFRGIKVNASDIQPRDPEYLRALTGGDLPTKEEVIRSRSEIIQHALAFNYLVREVVEKGHSLTQIVIQKTHAILCADEPTKAPGIYRTERVAVRYGTGKKTTEFIRPSAIPSYMEKLVTEYNDDAEEAERQGDIDPVTLAARYCHYFVNIHPFVDGNGRLCRLLLNTILLKYAGVCIPIGSSNDEIIAYLGIAVRASKIFHKEDMEVRKEEQIGHLELARLVLKKSTDKLRYLARALKEN